MSLELTPDQIAKGFVINPRAIPGKYEQMAKDAEVAEKCIFCAPLPEEVVYELDDWYLKINIAPRTSGDLMAIPYRHVLEDQDLTNSDRIVEGELKKTGRMILRVLGYPVVHYLTRDGDPSMSDKTVAHLHTNIMPYREGLVTWDFQPVILKPELLVEKMKEVLGGLKNDS